MSIFEIAVIGVALATDAFALTVANCAAYEKSLTRRKEWAMPCTFALFQFLMPVAGFFLGSLTADFLQSFAKFLTAGIFFVLAIKIVFDVIGEKRKGEKNEIAPARAFGLPTLLIQAIATSIDAFAVGITFAASDIPASIFVAAGFIGIITFAIVAFALLIGKSLGKLLGKYAVWAGAIILFALAIKNLIEGII